MPRTAGQLRLEGVDTFSLIGGGRVMARLLTALPALGRRVVAFAGTRHAEEVVTPDGRTLADVARAAGVELRSPDDINDDPVFLAIADRGGVALGFGETWSFTAATVNRFAGRLIDVMGIPLPRYRGGAHYTWMILAGNRASAIHLQLITEHMRQGEFDDGPLLKSRLYDFPETARIPEDYFAYAERAELDFLTEFAIEIKDGRSYELAWPDESKSLYMPRLHTLTHGWVDWDWKADDIVRFVCAFDEPYKGASTTLAGRRVFLKGARLIPDESSFHPFQAGLVFRIASGAIHVAARDGVVSLERLTEEGGQPIALSQQLVGARLFTPRSLLEGAREFRAEYNDRGLANADR